MTDEKKLEKLITRLKSFIGALERRRALQIHRTINQSYYMQKVAELQMLYERLSDLQEKQRKTCDLISSICPDVFQQFCKDLRWLQKFEVRRRPII
jgi:hypothetical protein